jgi:hypothetical protein
MRRRQDGGTHIAHELVRDIRELTCTANELKREITRIVRGLASALLALQGCTPGVPWSEVVPPRMLS